MGVPFDERCYSCDGDGFESFTPERCHACGGSGRRPTEARVTGTVSEPVIVPKSAGDRYCYLCDTFMRARVCKACGLKTERAAA
jgi:DnaJ-class molecular chaperone